MCGPLQARSPVRESFDRVCAGIAAETGAAPDGAALTFDFEPIFWVIAQLHETARRLQLHSADQLEPLVRRRLVEISFVDQGGDTVIDPHYQLDLERKVRLVMTVLGQVMHLESSAGASTASTSGASSTP
ncbi:MAG: hypothetical protein CMJ18_14460 [Phycisphaeraceae bacterium]|nr:hypothetical protein [Phycisphaeraceae bacterium]